MLVIPQDKTTHLKEISKSQLILCHNLIFFKVNCLSYVKVTHIYNHKIEINFSASFLM